MALSNPTEIARETLRQLALKRQQPTPEHYRRTYAEVAGLPPEAEHPALQKLVEAATQGARSRVEQQRLEGRLEELAAAQDWPGWVGSVTEALAAAVPSATLTQPWADMVRELVRQWDLRQVGWTSAKKREALERVLINFGSDPLRLNEKLAGLLRTWSDNLAPTDDLVGEPLAGETAVEADTPLGEVWAAWQALFRQTLELGVVGRLEHVPELQEEARALAVRIGDIRDVRALQALEAQTKKFWIKLELQNESEQTLILGLQRLLRLLVDNIAELVVDDGWLQGQVEVIHAIVEHPLDGRQLQKMEQSLSELIFKQGNLKQSLVDARATFKQLVATFVDRLGVVADVAGDYHDKIGVYADEIRGTDDLATLGHLVEQLMEDTHSMQLDMLRSRDEMRSARQEAEAAEARILALETELESVSQQVKTDQLTGALNRRGLDEAFVEELSRADREKAPLTVALLDLDNFKRVNDQLGHQGGDAALTHLSSVVRDVLRPTDKVARYGGEEFVILLPNTAAEEAVTVMNRVQRELTRRFFLHNNERLLITFSCGVATYRPGDDADTVLARADAAMYQAKLAGKNRVLVAE